MPEFVPSGEKNRFSDFPSDALFVALKEPVKEPFIDPNQPDQGIAFWPGPLFQPAAFAIFVAFSTAWSIDPTM